MSRCQMEGGREVILTDADRDKFSLTATHCVPVVALDAALPEADTVRSYELQAARRAMLARSTMAAVNPHRAGRAQPVVPRQRALRAAQARLPVNDAAIAEVARYYGIDPLFLHAIVRVESGYNPRALSPAGARGLMQLIPATARRFGVAHPDTDLYDPGTNLQAGAQYLKYLQGQFGNDLPLVLAAYNAGEGAVARYGDKVPPYKETQGYVRDVLGRYLALRASLR